MAKEKAVQITSQILPVVLELIASLQKKKWLMMFFYMVQSFSYVIMYIVFGKFSAMVLSVIATFILFVYFIFDLKKLKPNIYFLIVFEMAYIIGSLLTMESAFDILPLSALLMFGYCGWQDNPIILKSGYVLGSIVNIIYMLVIGAYIAVIVDYVCFAGNLFSLIFYNILKKDKLSIKLFNKKTIDSDNVTNYGKN